MKKGEYVLDEEETRKIEDYLSSRSCFAVFGIVVESRQGGEWLRKIEWGLVVFWGGWS